MASQSTVTGGRSTIVCNDTEPMALRYTFGSSQPGSTVAVTGTADVKKQ